MAAALSRVYAGLCRRDRLTSKECPFWLDSLFCVTVITLHLHITSLLGEFFNAIACSIKLIILVTFIYTATFPQVT